MRSSLRYACAIPGQAFLWLDASAPGAAIHFTLPVAKFITVFQSSCHD
jgi:hypothetical protein